MKPDSCILGIETSCDETAAAVVCRTGDRLRTLSSIVATQHDLHQEFRGVVPEIASRAHLQHISPVVDRALTQAARTLGGPLHLSAVAATNRPGLIGSLLVGLSYAKALAMARQIPFIAVDHVTAHLAAAQLDCEAAPRPALGLVVSGGHTSIFRMSDAHSIELIGCTIDDAAGEAFDKAATILGIGYPGGPALDELAESGDPSAFVLPSGKTANPLDFSFSGLKTALLYAVRGGSGNQHAAAASTPLSDHARADFAASFRRAVVATIIKRVELALASEPSRALIAGGGVVANRLLRRELVTLAQTRGISLHMPPLELCVDNGAMVAASAHSRLQRGEHDGWEIGAEPISAIKRVTP